MSQPAHREPAPPPTEPRPPRRPPDPLLLAPVPRSPHPADLCRLLPGLALACVGLTLAACNEHPTTLFEQSVAATVRQTSELPARARVDLLFVIDDSGSMCEEQTALADNFARLSGFFFDRLGAEADLRVAVTTTDLVNGGGRFVSEPPPLAQAACEGVTPPALDCADVAGDPILATGEGGNVGRDCAGLDGAAREGCLRADLERRFRCLATRGTSGASRETGLEAMRRALACDGPNAARFGACCTPAGFDPLCAGEGPPPDFLRPDALLVVVFVADEDDCSTPADNPRASERVICRYGPGDADGDGLPDGFRDRALCRGRDPAACLAVECGGLDPAACHAARCAVPEVHSACAWADDALTPVGDFVRALAAVKARPEEQLLVAAIVGERVYTPAGFPVRYAAGDPASRGAACVPEAPSDPDPPRSDSCCPEGLCLGDAQPACATEFGTAFTGERYLRLAETVGALGVDCVEPGTSLCDGDLVGPLEALTGCIERSLVRFCLDKPVVDPAAVRATLSCLDPARCDPLVPPVRLDPAAFAVSEDLRCAGGWVVHLDAPPPPGARLALDYLVELDAP